jgi:methanogenic corrinoid protein MtbC1
VSIQENIVDAFLYLDESAVRRLVKSMLDAGVNPVEIMENCRRGMLAIGERFERGEFFLSEMIMAAEIFKQVTEQIRPHFGGSASEARGRVVIGTVEGDIHDIGKNIFTALLEVEGFDVVDLGVDVPPATFVEAIRNHNPDIVGMSCLLSTSIEAMKNTVDAITEAGLRDKARIIIGGGRLERHAAEYVKPDAYTDNAAQGVKMCIELMRGEENE